MRIISVTGGKGGIGKTTLAVNLAIRFARQNKKVLLFDTDLGLANVDVLLGLAPRRTVQDVLAGHCRLAEACVQGPHGLRIVPAASGIQAMAELAPGDAARLIHEFSTLTDEIDIMLIDTAAGISNQVMDFTHATQDVLVVLCNDPASLMDSYAVIKILYQKYGRKRFGVLVNKVKHAHEGFDVFGRFQQATARFLPVSMHYMGAIPQDDCIALAARERIPFVDSYHDSAAAKAIGQLCVALEGWSAEAPLQGGLQFFFERLVNPLHSVAHRLMPVTESVGG